MKLHDLKPQEGSKKERKRVGRGISAGQGKPLAGGQKVKEHAPVAVLACIIRAVTCRSSAACRLCVVKDLPRLNQVEYNEINLDQLADFTAGSEITPETWLKRSLLRDTRNPVVILGRGEVKAALKVQRPSRQQRRQG